MGQVKILVNFSIHTLDANQPPPAGELEKGDNPSWKSGEEKGKPLLRGASHTS